MLRFTTLSDDVSCFECGRPVPYGSLEDHMIGSHAYRRCPQCNLLFNLYRLEEHIKRYHDKNEKRHFYIECEVCGALESPIKMDLHLKDCHGYKPCPKCGIVIEPRKLNNHIKNSH
ncbi:MAG: hypothetical protein KKD69_03915 [Euryarchaeota archaeon]|nr:hypothetical protein [Euryarchaeota archaeon]MBU4491590.1 hypothetical protein [Euryarchaeota archaeon]MCG2727929.1 hypothetical protein [Candidatus Methanoperedenaceae archaeon]